MPWSISSAGFLLVIVVTLVLFAFGRWSENEFAYLYQTFGFSWVQKQFSKYCVTHCQRFKQRLFSHWKICDYFRDARWLSIDCFICFVFDALHCEQWRQTHLSLYFWRCHRFAVVCKRPHHQSDFRIAFRFREHYLTSQCDGRTLINLLCFSPSVIEENNLVMLVLH